MSLRFKRNLPIILLLIAFLSFLAFATGNLHIIAYTLKVESPHAEQETTMRFDNATDDTLMVSPPIIMPSYDGSQNSDGDGMLYAISGQVNDV